MEFTAIMVLGTAIGFCIGFVYSDVKFRKHILSEMEAERVVLKDTLKMISETHNGLVNTQAGLDLRMADLEQKVVFMVQGVKK